MKQNRTKRLVIIGSIVISLSLLTTGFILAKIILSDDDGNRKRAVHMVTLIKPPPPPKIPEKPPEPEIKKEEIKEPEPEEQETVDNQNPDDAPPGEQLGLDAEGGVGADGFGLAAKKGGRSLIGSGGTQYAWYYNMIVSELQEIVNRLMRENGGIPNDKLKTVVLLTIDDNGQIVSHDIVASSGNKVLDKTVEEAIMLTQINEPPPLGMPRAMKFRISPQG